MATRWDIGLDTSSKTPSWGGGTFAWEADGATKYEIRTSAQSPTIGTRNGIQVSEVSGVSDYDVGLVQLITQALASQTLNSGATFRVQFLAGEEAAAANDYIVLVLKQYNSGDSLVSE